MSIDLGSVSIGWREVVVGLIFLIALYMFFVVWRMRRLEARGGVASASGPAIAEGPREPTSGLAESEDAGWQTAQSHMAQDAIMRGMEQELLQLRDEVDALRGEVAALRDEMRQEVGHMRASQTVSPLYTDAMQMAQQGHDAATIAECCGIARAEAELVVALVKSQNN